MSDDKPWWWPVPMDDEWRDYIRHEYYSVRGAEEVSDEQIDYIYGNGSKYVDVWDHLGDARASYEKLADAFFKLLNETGKTWKDFV